MSHVGRLHHTTIPKAVDQTTRLLFDAQQTVVNQMMVRTTQRKQVLFAVPAPISSILEVVDVQPQAVFAPGHPAAMAIALQHGSAHGGRDGAREVTTPLPLAHLQDLAVATGLSHVGL
jgi:hypothetical protein